MVDPAVDFDRRMMDRALRLARRGLGRTAPNPVVGCVLVQDGQVVGEGFHPKAGAGHAEVFALREAGSRARGATAYVTLEPCSHYGRTPPCVDALIQAGVVEVVAAMGDPDERVAGRGFERLKEAGIVVRVGVRQAESVALNRPFVSRILRGRPLLTVKMAASMDGKTATQTGQSQWITGVAARVSVGRLRDTHDVIMVGIGTVLADDPKLNCRIVGGRDPIRLVVDSQLRIPDAAQVWSSSVAAPLWLATVGAGGERAQYLQRRGAKIIACRDDGVGRVDLNDLLKQLGDLGINSVLSEAGAVLTGALMRSGLVDRLALYLAPMLIGGVGAPGLLGNMGVDDLKEAPRLHGAEISRVGSDFLLTASLGDWMRDEACLPV